MDRLLGHDDIDNILHQISSVLGVPRSLSYVEQVDILVSDIGCLLTSLETILVISQNYKHVMLHLVFYIDHWLPFS